MGLFPTFDPEYRSALNPSGICMGGGLVVVVGVGLFGL